MDINGDLRIRNLPLSNATGDIALVADQTGTIKKRVSESKGIFRTYLSQDITTPDEGTASSNKIYRITAWNEIDDPGNDFNSSTGYFTAPVNGLYKITMTLTSTYSTGTQNPTGTANTNYVAGLTNGSTNQWVVRFSMSKTYINELGSNSAIGVANTFVGLAQLTAGQTYYFGISGFLKLLANPTGTTGTGIGSFFEIQLIKNT